MSVSFTKAQVKVLTDFLLTVGSSISDFQTFREALPKPVAMTVGPDGRKICIAVCKNGNPCKKPARFGEWCKVHMPHSEVLRYCHGDPNWKPEPTVSVVETVTVPEKEKPKEKVVKSTARSKAFTKIRNKKGIKQVQLEPPAEDENAVYGLKPKKYIGKYIKKIQDTKDDENDEITKMLIGPLNEKEYDNSELEDSQSELLSQLSDEPLGSEDDLFGESEIEMSD